MEDTLDVLKISREGDGPPPAKKKTRPKTRRPEGISREAYSLMDGNHPIVQTTPYRKRFVRKEGLNKKRKGDVSYAICYKWKSFRNEARSDTLELKKWVKCYINGEGNFREALPNEYPFAKLNKPPDVVRYSDLEWDRCLASLTPSWSKEETEYLLDLCRQFSLRFPVIYDRYAFSERERSYDELKERYYAMAHALACFRSGEELPSKYLQKHPYDAAYERRRREACRMVTEMTWEEEWRDNAILEQAERIEAQRLEGATMTPSISSEAGSDVSLSQAVEGQEQWESSPLHDIQGEAYRPEPGIYVRGVMTRQWVTESEKPAQQSVMQEFSVETCFPTVCTQKLMKAWIDLWNDACVLAELREQVDPSAALRKTETRL